MTSPPVALTPAPLRCHLLIGPPASGKTTLAGVLAQLTGAVVLSTDVVRGELFGDEAVQGPWRDIEALLHQRPLGHGVLGIAAEVGRLQRQPVLAQVAQVAARAVAADEGMLRRLRGGARVAMLLHPGRRRVEARLGIADEAADQVGLVGPQVAHRDVGLTAAQVAHRV
jgi:hypothetical protein